jgi:hypothetical protein
MHFHSEDELKESSSMRLMALHKDTFSHCRDIEFIDCGGDVQQKSKKDMKDCLLLIH